jgi:hypothetical protein
MHHHTYTHLKQPSPPSFILLHLQLSFAISFRSSTNLPPPSEPETTINMPKEKTTKRAAKSRTEKKKKGKSPPCLSCRRVN